MIETLSWWFLAAGNNKFLILIIGLMVVGLFLRGYSYQKILIILLLVVLPFERGLRGWMVPVVSGLNDQDRIGYSFYFGLSLKFLLVLLISLSYFREIKYSKWFLVILGWSGLSVMINGSDFISVLGWIRMVYLCLLSGIFNFYFKEKENRMIFLRVVTGWLFFMGLVGCFQFARQNFIGLMIEEAADVSRFGYLTNESQFLYRVSGVMGHPTFFGSWLSMVIAIGFGYYLRLKGGWKKVMVLVGLLGSFGSMFATYSRSSWLATALSLAVVSYWQSRKVGWKGVLKEIRVFLVIGALLGMVYGAWVLVRLRSFENVFTLGSGRGRIELAREALNMIRNNPIFGVGLNRFTEAMVKQNISGAAEYFLYPVHNTWLLMAAEMGLVALVFWVVLIGRIMRHIPDKLVVYSVWLGALTFLFNSQLHTLFNQDPSLDLFIILLAYLESRWKFQS